MNSLSDLRSYSSDLNSHAQSNDDDDKWVYDDPLPKSKVQKKKKSSSKSETDASQNDEEPEQIPKLTPGTEELPKLSKDSNQSSKQSDISESSPELSEESSSHRSSKKSVTSEKSTVNNKSSRKYHPQIQIALSENKLAFADGVWQDVSEIGDLVDKIHPIVAESISLQKRAELLVRLIAESEYESQLIQKEMDECDEVIKGLRKVLGENEEEGGSSSIKNSEEDDESF